MRGAPHKQGRQQPKTNLVQRLAINIFAGQTVLPGTY
jgi:hypothetical protein